jgi:hypothetical protein
MSQIEELNVLHRINSVDRRADRSGRAHLCSLSMTANYQSATNQCRCGKRDNMSAHHLSPVVALKDPAVPTPTERQQGNHPLLSVQFAVLSARTMHPNPI